jgi:hypothetical protein
MRGGDRDRRRRGRVGRGDGRDGRRSHRGGGEGPTRQRGKDQGITGGEGLG